MAGEIAKLPHGWTRQSPFDRPLDADFLSRDPRIEAAAEALHDARRPAMEGRIYAERWGKMWPEYQAQLRREAVAVIWAIDRVSRTHPPEEQP